MREGTHKTESRSDGTAIQCKLQKIFLSMYVLVGPFDQGNEPLGSFKDMIS